jgi:hypothetical protein
MKADRCPAKAKNWRKNPLHDPALDLEKRTIRKVMLRIIPFIFVLYIISYLDRANISYAALQMNHELGLSSEAFGFASGIFFIGYFLFEVPSNMMLAGVALAGTAATRDPFISMTLVSAALAGLYAFKSPFWALPGLFLTPATAAISIAAINSIGNLGGFAGPYVLGVVKDWTGSALGGLLFLSALLFVSFLMTWLVRLKPSETGASAETPEFASEQPRVG